MNFRPWGTLGWALSHLSGRQIDLVCGLNPAEDRSLTAAIELSAAGMLRSLHLIYVEDPRGEVDPRIDPLLDQVAALQTEVSNYSIPLLAGLEEIVALTEGIVSRLDDHVLFDISTLPKRLFFAMAKFLRREPFEV